MNKQIKVSYKDIVIDDNFLRRYAANKSILRAGDFDLVKNEIVIYRYSLAANIDKAHPVAKIVSGFNANRARYIAYYSRKRENYAKLPKNILQPASYSDVLLKYVAEVSAITEGFLVGKIQPNKQDILSAVLQAAEMVSKKKKHFAKEHMDLNLTGVQLFQLLNMPVQKAPAVYDSSFRQLCRQFLTFGNICLLDLDKKSPQAKQIRAFFNEAQKYYEDQFGQGIRKARKVSPQTVTVGMQQKNVDFKVLNVANPLSRRHTR